MVTILQFLRQHHFFPEYATAWMLKELDSFDKRPSDAFYLTDEVKEDIKELCPFWDGRTTLDKGYALMPELYHQIHEAGIIRAEGNLTSGDAHIAVNNEKILSIGIKGYLEEVTNQRKALDLTDYSNLKKEQFYKSVEIAIGAISTFILRFSEMAKELSEEEKNFARASELFTISENCRQIASNPPNNFYQGLQLTYFLQLILQIESNGHSLSLGRMDQYLYPLYKKDLESGAITMDFARELLECTWVKLLAVKKIRSWSHTKFSAGGPLYQNVTIGGQTVDGQDAVNPLSYLILESVGNTNLHNLTYQLDTIRI